MFFRQNIASIQGDARHLPLPDESVDLIMTSPPYFALRDYQDQGESVRGQLGNEPTPQEFLDSLVACTREWMRVLKPRGSIFVNLGDKYAGGGGQWAGNPSPLNRGSVNNRGGTWGFRSKSLLNLPGRYAIRCTDELGLVQRAEIVWSKPNGLPESVKDRVRRSHEMLYHFTKEGDYYEAVDRIRQQPEEVKTGGKQVRGRGSKAKTWEERKALGEPMRYGDTGNGASGAFTGGVAGSPLGKLPPSVWDDAGPVWEIPTFPLNVPKDIRELFEVWYEEDGERFEVDHYAAFPPELVRRVVLGWSPQHVCTKCGQGRFPVTEKRLVAEDRGNIGSRGEKWDPADPAMDPRIRTRPREAYGSTEARIIGNACACTPYEDHPENRGKDWRGTDSGDRKITGQRMGKDFQGNGHPSRSGGQWNGDGGAARDEWGRGQVREYKLDDWQPAPTTQGVVLDPMGGTGTTAIVAAILGRRGITCDLSHDYAGRMVSWRMNDRAQMRSLLGG